MAEDLSVTTVATALREVAHRLGNLPYGVSVEKAFVVLAKELEHRALNLDPEPYVYRGKHPGMHGERKPIGARYFYGEDEVVFQPREEYEQDESAYPEWVDDE